MEVEKNLTFYSEIRGEWRQQVRCNQGTQAWETDTEKNKSM